MTATLPITVTIESPAPQSDAELVDRFATVRDPAAFTELVHRYSHLVLGVCRRVLRDPCDVEDVFQATFLVLVRDAARIRRQQSLASWLYGVAYRLSLRVARQKQRRRETMIADDDGHTRDTLTAVADRYDQQLVDMELNALPDRYRQPMVLRYLCGKSSQEIADDLKLTVGTVDGLLKRGKDELRTRLMRRGVTLGAALAAVQGACELLPAVDPLSLVDNTVQAGLAWQNGLDLPSDVLSNRALELSGKELVAMTTITKSGVAAGLALGALILGWGTLNLLEHGGAGRVDAGEINSVRSSAAASNVASADVAVVAQGPAVKADAAGVTTSIPQGPPSQTVDSVGRPETPEVTVGPSDVARAPGGRGGLRPVIAPSKPWDARRLNERELRLETALRERTEFSFTDNPLHETLRYISDLHLIEVTVDKLALESESIPEDIPINLKISGVSLKSALHLLLDPLNLDYVIQNETLTITTRSKAESLFETRVYNIRRLKGMTPAELDEIIRATIAPESWSAVLRITEAPTNAAKEPAKLPMTDSPSGGGGLAGVVVNGGGLPTNDEGNIRFTKNSLIIRQTQRVHDEIVDLLNQLEKTMDDPEPTEAKVFPRGNAQAY